VRFLLPPPPPFCSGTKPEIHISNVALSVYCTVGYAEKGPYDAIHVGAAARTIPPALVEQLATPGRMIIPVGTYSQKLMQVDKDAEGRITQRDLFGVVVRILSFFLARHRTSWSAYTFLFRCFALSVCAAD
jgi:protein-L-isoaspartate O-methyltransferase